MTFAGSNRRMRKTARSVVWKGHEVKILVTPSDPMTRTPRVGMAVVRVSPKSTIKKHSVLPSLPRTSRVRPCLWFCYQACPNRVHANVLSLFFCTFVIANPVIEKAALPTHARGSSKIPAPVGNHWDKAFLCWETDKRMEMVGHHRDQNRVPSTLLVVNPCCLQDKRTQRWTRQGIDIALGCTKG